jgi:hypothetical protein
MTFLPSMPIHEKVRIIEGTITPYNSRHNCILHFESNDKTLHRKRFSQVGFTLK